MGFFLNRSWLGIAVLALLGGCSPQEQVESFGGPTMGSTYSVQYVRDANTPPIDDLKQRVQSILDEVDAQMSTYRADSTIEVFNQGPAGCTVVPEPVRHLVLYGEQLSQASNGAFDLTVEPLLNLWGFGPQGQAWKVPSDEALAEVRKDFGHQWLKVEGDQLCKDREAIQVDFNSIAAGYAVDRIATALEESGVARYLVEATGELKAKGKKPDNQPWRIAIEAPETAQRTAQRIIALDGYGVSTSGDYRNFFEENGQRYSHTLDPRTGAPIQHNLAAVTVVHPSALEADGLSTLLMVLGPDEGYRFADEHGLLAFFVSRSEEGFVTHSTPAFSAFIDAQESQR